MELRRIFETLHAENDALKKAGHITPYVFVRLVAQGKKGPKKPERVKGFAKAWKSACVAAGCPGRVIHDLRRTAIRNLTRSGVSERIAMQLSGHLTRSVFDRYDITSEGDLFEAAGKLDRLDETVAARQGGAKR